MAKPRPLCAAQARVCQERACLVFAIAVVCFGKRANRTANASIYHVYISISRKGVQRASTEGLRNYQRRLLRRPVTVNVQ